MNKLTFLTGNRTKLAHLRYLAKDYNIQIIYFHEKTYHANYEEPRIWDRSILLKESLKSAQDKISKSGISKQNLFLIEDTSVVISALSDNEEVPGVDIKYWMRENTFKQLNQKLTKANNRSVYVRSDMVLFSHDLSIKESFFDCTFGTIVEKEQEISTNILFPWLDATTFNKWFVPENCINPISLLPIKEADKYDFRRRTFNKLINYLKQNNLFHKQVSDTKPIFKYEMIIVVGYSCAGKTTIAQYIDTKLNFLHLEASDFMKLCFMERHGNKNKFNLEDFALAAINEEPEIVADKMVEELAKIENLSNVIITGYRSPKEFNVLKSKLNDFYNIQIINIDSTFENRLNRSIIRNRDGVNFNEKKLKIKDNNQYKMGLDNFKCESISNNSSKTDFFKKFEDWINSNVKIKDTKFDYPIKIGNLHKNVLLFLYDKYKIDGKGAYYSSNDISKETNHHKDNVSRFFNQHFFSDFEVKVIGEVAKYRLSNSGYSKVHKIKKLEINNRT